jgi:hypothetical protein
MFILFLFLAALVRLGQFQELCSSTKFPALKNLHFSLCFPQEIEHTWRISSFNCNRQWPFDNINSYIDECYMRDVNARQFIPKILFVIYNCPLNLLYRHKRSFHNHGFATHVSTPIRTIRRQFVQWTCDQHYEAKQFNKTLQIIASGHVKELHLTYLNERVSQKKINQMKLLSLEFKL